MDSQEVSQRSRKSLAKSLYQGIRRRDAPGDIPPWSRLQWCLQGFTRVVCETIERLISQDRCWRMANTQTAVNRKPARSSKQSNDESVYPQACK